MRELSPNPGSTPAGLPQSFPVDGGEMGRNVHAFDWSTTALGPIAGWPQWLRTTVQNLLECGQPVALWVGPDMTTIFNDGFAPILGQRAATALGKPMREVWFDVWDEIVPLVERTLGGERIWMENMPLQMTRNGFDEETHWTFSYSPVRDENGIVRGMLDTVTETTAAAADRKALMEVNERLAIEVERTRKALEAKVEAEKHQRVLQRELSHRMKNTLSMVQAVVTQSLRQASDLSTAGQMAAARIQALARAQDILTASDWTSSKVGAVVGAAIVPHLDGNDRIRVDGPEVEVSAQQALGLALAIHELATNSAKYGALSSEHGTVAVQWDALPGDKFSFAWREEGGPLVVAPARRGFGSRLTERVVPTYFNGKASIDFDPAGLIYRMDGSLDAGRQERS